MNDPVPGSISAKFCYPIATGGISARDNKGVIPILTSRGVVVVVLKSHVFLAAIRLTSICSDVDGRSGGASVVHVDIHQLRVEDAAGKGKKIRDLRKRGKKFKGGALTAV